MAQTFVGIDPGLSGGIAVYYLESPAQSQVWGLPLNLSGKGGDGRELRSIFEGVLHQNPAFAIEHVASRPRQAGVFNFGLNTGIIHGVMGCLGIDFEAIPSSKWKPAMGLKRLPTEEYKENKERSRLLALTLFPHLSQQLALKKDDGKAEALLLAVYLSHRTFRKAAR